MLYLSETDRIKAKADAIRTLAINANSALSDRLSKREDKEKEIAALMAIEWTPGLARAVGPDPLNKLIKRLKNDVSPSGEYEISRDMLARATDDSITAYESDWRILHELIIRLHLFEIAELREWIALVGRFDSKGIRTPRCLARIPFGELSRMNWESPPSI